MPRRILFVLLFTIVTSKVRGEEVCWDDVGCFDDDRCHKVGFPPRSPDYINVRFYLYTRRNVRALQELRRDDRDSLRASNFDPKRKTKISVHGWFSSGFTSSELARKDAFLEVENVNVIIVDWKNGAAEEWYGRAHQNTRVVGREIALMLRFLNLEKGMYYKDVHMVGMSLGAHVVGYAGEFKPGISRITGLDPAGPFFRDEVFDFRSNGPQCRLDPTDAIFVDVIHTDANDITGLGQMLQMGHQDFYPNGGRRQPGCTGSDFSGCSHSRATRLFTASIRTESCTFTAYPCDSWAQFSLGNCGGCGRSGCAVMGYRVDKNTAVRGQFYLETTAEPPYCLDKFL